MKIEEKIERWKKLVEDYIDKNLPSSKQKPEILNKAIRYSIFSGGKRLRPILVFCACEIFDIEIKQILPVAAGIELIHNFSLIHDDLPSMDNDDFRRGIPTCHKKFGEGIAILAGDALLTYGFKFIAETGEILLIKDVADAIGSEGMAGGQALDLINKNRKISEKEKKRVDYMKTGRLFEICFKVPFYFKKVKNEAKDKMEKIAKDFGLAFQIRDDIEDNEGDIQELKKNLNNIYNRMKKNTAGFGKKSSTLIFIIDKVYKEFL